MASQCHGSHGIVWHWLAIDVSVCHSYPAADRAVLHDLAENLFDSLLAAVRVIYAKVRVLPDSVHL